MFAQNEGHLIFTTGQSLAERRFAGDGGDGVENSFSDPYGVLPLFMGSPSPNTVRWWDINISSWNAYDIQHNSGGIDTEGRTKVYHRPDIFMGMAINGFLRSRGSESVYLWHYPSTVSNKSYLELKKGTPYFDNLINMLGGPVYKRRERPIRWATQVIGHGERDTALQTGDTTYLSYLIEWRDDFKDAIGTVSENVLPQRTYLYQTQSHTFYNQATPSGPGRAQLAAHELYPRDFSLCTPLYPLETTDGIHLTKMPYFKLGHYFAKAWMKEVVDGQRWESLRPLKVMQAGPSTIAVVFNVPVPPLVFDTNVVTDPGHYGFESEDTGGAVITAIALDAYSDDTVLITLNQPISSDAVVRYAWTGNAGASCGPTSGARGCLRDSDATRTVTGATFDLHGSLVASLPVSESLYNYAVGFEKEVDYTLWGTPSIKSIQLIRGSGQSSIELSLGVTAGQFYSIQKSYNLRDWIDVLTIFSDSSEMRMRFLILGEQHFFRVSTEGFDD